MLSPVTGNINKGIVTCIEVQLPISVYSNYTAIMEFKEITLIDIYKALSAKGAIKLLMALNEKKELGWEDVKKIIPNDRTLSRTTTKLLEMKLIHKRPILGTRHTEYSITDNGKVVLEQTKLFDIVMNEQISKGQNTLGEDITESKIDDIEYEIKILPLEQLKYKRFF